MGQKAEADVFDLSSSDSSVESEYRIENAWANLSEKRESAQEPLMDPRGHGLAQTSQEAREHLRVLESCERRVMGISKTSREEDATVPSRPSDVGLAQWVPEQTKNGSSSLFSPSDEPLLQWMPSMIKNDSSPQSLSRKCASQEDCSRSTSSCSDASTTRLTGCRSAQDFSTMSEYEFWGEKPLPRTPSSSKRAACLHPRRTGNGRSRGLDGESLGLRAKEKDKHGPHAYSSTRRHTNTQLSRDYASFLQGSQVSKSPKEESSPDLSLLSPISPLSPRSPRVLPVSPDCVSIEVSRYNATEKDEKDEKTGIAKRFQIKSQRSAAPGLAEEVWTNELRRTDSVSVMGNAETWVAAHVSSTKQSTDSMRIIDSPGAMKREVFLNGIHDLGVSQLVSQVIQLKTERNALHEALHLQKSQTQIIRAQQRKQKETRFVRLWIKCIRSAALDILWAWHDYVVEEISRKSDPIIMAFNHKTQTLQEPHTCTAVCLALSIGETQQIREDLERKRALLKTQLSEVQAEKGMEKSSSTQSQKLCSQSTLCLPYSCLYNTSSFPPLGLSYLPTQWWKSASPCSKGPGPGIFEMNLFEMRLKMRFESTGQEGSIQRQCFTRDLKQDLANASGMETSHFNILKLSKGSVIVDMIAPETAAQEIHRQSLDPFSKLRSGKITKVLERVSLQNDRLLNQRNNTVTPAPPMMPSNGESTYYGAYPPCDGAKDSGVVKPLQIKSQRSAVPTTAKKSLPAENANSVEMNWRDDSEFCDWLAEKDATLLDVKTSQNSTPHLKKNATSKASRSAPSPSQRPPTPPTSPIPKLRLRGLEGISELDAFEVETSNTLNPDTMTCFSEDPVYLERMNKKLRACAQVLQKEILELKQENQRLAVGTKVVRSQSIQEQYRIAPELLTPPPTPKWTYASRPPSEPRLLQGHSGPNSAPNWAQNVNSGHLHLADPAEVTSGPMFSEIRNCEECMDSGLKPIGDGGVGISLVSAEIQTEGHERNVIKIKSLAPDGPAAMTGLLQVGDVLLQVDGQDVSQMDPMAVKHLVKGPVGTLVRLRAQRANQTAHEVTLERSGCNDSRSVYNAAYPKPPTLLTPRRTPLSTVLDYAKSISPLPSSISPLPSSMSPRPPSSHLSNPWDQKPATKCTKIGEPVSNTDLRASFSSLSPSLRASYSSQGDTFSMDEAVEYFQKSKDLKTSFSRDEAVEIFRQIDANGIGEISQIEFIKALQRNSALAKRLALPNEIRQEDELFALTFKHTSRTYTFDHDKDQNPAISLEEFVSYYRKDHKDDASGDGPGSVSCARSAPGSGLLWQPPAPPPSHPPPVMRGDETCYPLFWQPDEVPLTTLYKGEDVFPASPTHDSPLPSPPSVFENLNLDFEDTVMSREGFFSVPPMPDGDSTTADLFFFKDF